MLFVMKTSQYLLEGLFFVPHAVSEKNLCLSLIGMA